MNIFIGMGRLTSDPEFKDNNGTSIARYSLAIERSYKKGEERTVDFIRCVTFGKSAEFAKNYLKKGTKIAIRGRIQTGSYVNKDGQKVYTTDIVVDEHNFCESKGASAGTSEPVQQTASAPAPAGDISGFMSIPDGIEEELPFG